MEGIMALFRGQTFTGIVVSRKNYKERDMLVRILTSSFGFKTFFVRGVRKRGFKWGAGIIPFTKATYIGDISTTGLSFITNVSDAEQYHHPHKSVVRYFHWELIHLRCHQILYIHYACYP